jgi:class 3 adenylate cyclase/predicted ATPase
MVCPNCKAESPDGSKFCVQCGALLLLACPSCGHGNSPLANFCASCGTVLTAGAPLSPAIVAPASSAERRQLTVMFCDLVGSTALSVRLDPEDLREVIVAYQIYVAETVVRFGGFVAKYMGDGVLAYFGYPQAHEHASERAARAGLELVRGLYERDWPSNIAPQIRIGIATGLVVVGNFAGEDATQQHGIVGETPNLAARLQALAQPNTVVIAPTTRRLTGGLFDYRDLGALALKGFADTVRAWQVMGLSAAESRFEALREAGVAPLLGRDEELELLLRRWQQAKNGEGRVVLLSGESGIGKSRLGTALLERIAGEQHLRLRYFCSPHHTDSALHPIIGQLERAARFERDDDSSTKLDKLQAMLSYGSPSADDASLIAELLSLAGIDRRYPRLDLAPQQRKQKTLEALRRLVEAPSRHRPILAIFEDVQWIDPTSLELLDRMIELVPRLPILLLVTFRPDFDAPWAGRPQVQTLALNRLSRPASAALVGRFGGSDGLPHDVVEEILERTDGVPLFIEELTKAVVEAGETEARVISPTPPVPHRIPTTLHASLTSRLDRLGPAKELAQVGAVIGRRFSYALLAAVADRDESELHALLDQITAAGLVFQEGTWPHATFRFKHALVQSVAYESLLRSARQQLHARIAATLEAAFPATEPEQLAQHWAQAGDAERAVSNWRKAGQQAIQRSANREAIAQLTKGLRMLERLPHGLERDRTELDLQLLLAEALMADKGWTAPETRPCYDRARELCDRIGDTEGLFPVLYGQFSHHLSRGEADAAHGLALQTLQLTEGTGDAALRSMAHSMLGMSLFSRGELATALTHLRTALSLDQPDSRSHTFLSPGHNFAIASMWTALTLLLIGHPEQASVHAGAGLRVARELSNPHTLAHALALACRYHSVLGETTALHQATEELAALAAEHRFPFYGAAAQIYRGWVLSMAPDSARGIETLREGMAAFMDLGSIALRPYFSARIAVLSAAAGSARDGLDLLDQALEQVDQSGQRWCEAEIHRSKGELLSGVADAPQAESCLQRSLVTARRQGARLWELRAACSLGRLWRDQGRHNDARDLLGPIHGWFAEGFDTPDLKEAKALLDALSGENSR